MADKWEWFNMSGVTQAVFMNQRSFAAPPGQDAYTTAGTYTWIAPAGVTSVSVVAVGGGSYFKSSGGTFYGGGGGGLGYKNTITVTPGSSYTVVVGSGEQDSYFISTATVKGGAASGNGNPGTYTGDGGGNGGSGGVNSLANLGGGGAGGYSGNGGNGSSGIGAGANGAGGGGGGAGDGGAGGGVGILGQGSSGAGGASGVGGGGGSGGGNGVSNIGGAFGGGGIGGSVTSAGKGAVRIIYPGNTRLFPSANTGDL
jgi:hypothetical protein